MLVIYLMRHKYTEDDIEFLRVKYPQNKWDDIFDRFPDLSKDQIYSICSKHKIKSGYDRKNLISNLSSKRWTEDEDKILLNNYETCTMDKIMEMLPGRSYNAIICRARKYNLYSLQHTSQNYKDEEIQYIIDNWQKYSDHKIAEDLNRTTRAIKWMREQLGLFRLDPDRNLTYQSLERYLRGSISQWKAKSMMTCDYECVLTGSKNFAVHHLYSFNFIVRSFVSSYDIKFNNNINEYNNEELKDLAFKFNQFHDMFPLGVCVDKELHTLFHHLYGKNNNTPEQWNDFVENYKKGIYNH